MRTYSCTMSNKQQAVKTLKLWNRIMSLNYSLGALKIIDFKRTIKNIRLKFQSILLPRLGRCLCQVPSCSGLDKGQLIKRLSCFLQTEMLNAYHFWKVKATAKSGCINYQLFFFLKSSKQLHIKPLFKRDSLPSVGVQTLMCRRILQGQNTHS